jgi:hypothetical protein
MMLIIYNLRFRVMVGYFYRTKPKPLDSWCLIVASETVTLALEEIFSKRKKIFGDLFHNDNITSTYTT